MEFGGEGVVAGFTSEVFSDDAIGRGVCRRLVGGAPRARRDAGLGDVVRQRHTFGTHSMLEYMSWRGKRALQGAYR